jgi:pyruvate dehydrogenase E2 component (dihydrolipoamide acetyltransferase)
MLIDFKLPSLGENVESGDVVNVLVKEGDLIEGNRGVIELETEKAVVEIPCPHAGKIVKVHVKKGDRIKVGQTILTVEAEARVQGSGFRVQGSAVAQPARTASPRHPVTPSPETAGKPARYAGPVTAAPPQLLPAGPSARRLARESGVDLGTVQGTGTRGRITPEDVKAAGARGVEPGRAGPESAPAEAVVSPGEPASDPWGPVRRERMSQIRLAIAAQMSRSASTIPHVTNFDDADVTDLEHLRKGLPQGFLGANLKLTMMPLVMKAVALALRRHPVLNASLDDQKEEIVYKQYVNLGVAVDTPRGLVVPVVRSADRMSIVELARAVAEVAEKARTAKFALEELRGGTFTISNLGAVGGAYSTPIINHPEVAILLLGRSRWMPVVREGKIEPRLMLPLSLSYDHRLVDGAAAGRFLNEVIDYLQSPGKLLLEGTGG